MRFLIVNTDYSAFLSWFYARNPGLEESPYDQQLQARMETLFGIADFYSSNLRELGHEAWDVHVNNEFLQKAWAKEHGLHVDEMISMKERMRALRKQVGRMAVKTPIWNLRPVWRPLLGSENGAPGWFYDILAAQIRHYRPDVLLNQSMNKISSCFLKDMKRHVGLLIGQIASPIENDDFSAYDLVISSLPNFVKHFRSLGVRSELHRFAFEPAILTRLNGHPREITASFVGSISSAHPTRSRFLEEVCSESEIRVWGSKIDWLTQNSPILSRYEGSAWGIEMYRILHASKITLNYHIGIADAYANNMRLFEATGVGALLITDWKENLGDMFEPGKEVVAYRTSAECLELLRYYLDHDQERESIARAGQQRTLRDHNYHQRMGELVEIVSRYS